MDAAPTEEIQAPRALDSLPVEYPAGATQSATVTLELLISVDGLVLEAKVIDGTAPFSDAAIAAAAQWRFEPARRKGQAVRARIRMQLQFDPPVLEELEEPATPASTPEAPKELVPELDVTVKGERVVGVKKLARAEVRQLPGAFGDPYRAIEVLPGVTPIASGLPYFFVRGAPPGNVGYFFDGISVPLLYHVGAGPGVLHPAFVSSVDLYAGAYPAHYGRYAGGIVAGEAEAPQWRFRGEASIRLIDSGAFLEIPFADGKGSAMLAGRYSYTGLLISLLAPEVDLGYWDYQARVRYDLSPKDRLSLFTFGSHDFLSAVDDSGQKQDIIDLTFHRLDARYSRTVDAKTELNLTASLGLDRTGLGGDPESEEDLATLTAKSLGGRIELQHQTTPKLLLRGGVDGKFIRNSIDFNPDQDEEDNGNGGGDGGGGGGNDGGGGQDTGPPIEDRILPSPGFPNIVLQPLREANEDDSEASFNQRFLTRDDVLAAGWVSAVWSVTPNITLTPGFRLDLYKTGDSDWEIAPEPRIAARFDVSKTVSLTHDFGIAHQPPSFAIPLPGLSGAAATGLQRALQSSAGVETQLPAKLSAEAHVFQNAVFNSTDIFGTSNLSESDPASNPFSDRTTAHTYGFELQLKRSLTEKFGGFLSYTLSRSMRSIPRVKGVSSFDRTHVLNLALAYDLGRRWRLGARLVAYSGIPAEVAYPEAAKNPPRTPWFYRVDARLEKRWLIGSSGAWWALVLEMLNSTLNKEVLSSSCYAYGCQNTAIGPVVIPSIGAEASF